MTPTVSSRMGTPLASDPAPLVLPRPVTVGEAWRRFHAPALVCVGLLAFGYARTAPGTTLSARAYRGWAVSALADSDIIALHGDRGGGRHALPYLEDRIEYPVLLGLFMWWPSLVAPNPSAYFAVTYGALALCAIGALWLLCAMPHTEPWAFAASPALAVYAGLNWDLEGIFLLLLGVWLWARSHERWAAGVLALATWTKIFPAVPLWVLLSAALRRGARRPLELGATVLAVTLAVNLPFALSARENWLWFFRYNAIREIEPSLYLLLGADPRGFVRGANAICAVVSLSGALGLAALELRSRRVEPLPGAAALLFLFFAVNKVFSPQYWLWVVAMLALTGAPLWLGASVGAVALIDFVATFSLMHLHTERAWRELEWFRRQIFVPALWLRYVTLLACAGWAARRAVRGVWLSPLAHPLGDQADAAVLERAAIEAHRSPTPSQ